MEDRDGIRSRRFAMAPMDGAMRGFTAALCCVPLGFGVAALAGAGSACGAVALALPALYAGVWLWSRPREFVVGPEGVTLCWPLRRRTIAWSQIAAVRAAPSGRALREELGVAVRIGVGGLFGAFGWLWSARRGLCPVYVSRASGCVWLERRGAAPYLLSPERPDAFVEAARSRSG